MGSEITAIAQMRQVYSDTYANLPTTNLAIGDLGYATDRLVLYRWSGAAWEAITIHSSSGLAAAIPAAADLPNGSLYYETDTGITEQVQAGAWASISTPGAITATGSYAGNDSQNRAIPHGLGSIPTVVFIVTNDGFVFQIREGIALIYYLTASVDGSEAVTAPDATNFYVGYLSPYIQSANCSGETYKWVALS